MLLTTLFVLILETVEIVGSWDYCIIGAGPGGLQVAYYLQKTGLNYVIIERNSVPGSFFEVYPRRRTLISINKRHTGETNTEFNMRHDWNSLLSDDPEMVFTRYSKEMFPPADTLLEYFRDFAEKFKLNIHYNTNVDKVLQDEADDSFILTTSDSEVYSCRYVIASTGISVLYQLNPDSVKGDDFIEGYDTVTHNPDHYEGQKVLILGKGNSAFETADMIYGRTDFVHLVSRDRVKLSWNTHYVGDVRGVNNQLLDTYQLKSLDALLERDFDEGVTTLEKKNGRLYMHIADDDGKQTIGPYDRIINCLGFNFDPTPFCNLTKSHTDEDRSRKKTKYPEMGWDFQSTTVPNLYYAGTITHGLDKRLSSGGFIHGFRYTARSLAWVLAARNHGIRWPSVKVPLHGVVNSIMKRMNEMNGPYQMFYVLVDVYLRYGDTVEIFYNVPHGLLHLIHELLAESSGEEASHRRDMVVVRLEYGAGFSKVGGDPFTIDRTELNPFLAHTCNFIHPVLYHFTSPPDPVEIRSKKLRGYNHKIHLSEDLYTDFATLSNHVTPITNFISSIWGRDVSHLKPEDCLLSYLTTNTIKEMCKRHPPLIVNDQLENIPLRAIPELTPLQRTLPDLMVL